MSTVSAWAYFSDCAWSEIISVRANDELYKEGLRLLSDKNYDKAISILSRARAQGSTEVGVLVARGDAYYKLLRYPEALRDLSDALKEKPNHVYGLFLRAAIYDGVGQTHDAINDLRKIISMDPQNKTAYRLRGAGYLTLKEWDRALVDFNRAVALGEHTDGLYQNRALAHENLGHYDEAISDFSRSLELKPGHRGSLAHRGWMYLCLGDLDKGLEDLNTLILQSPNDMSARVRRGWTYLALKNFSAASSDLTYAIERKSELPLAYLNLAAVYYEAGDQEKALTTNAKIFLLPGKPILLDAFFQKGLILLGMNKDEEANAIYFQGRSLAEETSDWAGLESGIEDLRVAIKSAKANPQTAEQILRSLQEVEKKRKSSFHTQAHNDRCRRLIM